MILIDGKKPKICIDPGHGGHDSGAVGLKGQKESHLALQISKELRYQLELKNIDSYLTREENKFISLSNRSEVAKGATCFVSIHCNSFNSSNSEGIETLYGAPGGKSKALANYLQQALIKYCQGHRDRGIKMSPSQSYPRKLYVLGMNPCPASLVECEFISHPKQVEWLDTYDGQKQIAHALSEGIQAFLYSLPNGMCIDDEPKNDLKEFLEKENFEPNESEGCEGANDSN